MFLDFVKTHYAELKTIANAVRILSMDIVLKAKSGHCGLPLGGAEMGTFLYFACMNFQPKNLNWFNRDRFVLSAGHGSALQYALMHFAELGISIEDLSSFRQLHSLTPGHPEYGHTPGVEYTTGPLGQGFAGAVGMALAERMLAARLNINANIIDHHTYVIAGDGCMMEGVSSEAASFAGHLKLSRLIVLYDANNITIDGTIDITFNEDVGKRFEAYGWNVLHADGNDFLSLAQAMDAAHENSRVPNGEGKPSLIICKTLAGKGSQKWEGKPKIHGNPMSKEDVEEAKFSLGFKNCDPFSIPEECYKASKKLLNLRVEKSSVLHENAWQKYEVECHNAQFTLEEWRLANAKMATRVSSGKALALLAEKCPHLVGGSADLAGSNNTTLAKYSFVNAKDFSGRNIHFGVREHAMGAICNGLTVHGGLRAYCATFAVFSDYMRPALRIAALMNIPTIFIFTHDSFAVGEDGPTHQPIEHMTALRAIPNMNVYRPADGVETFAAWENLLKNQNPSCLLLTRQDVNNLNPNISQVQHAMNVGAYILKDFHKGDNENTEQIVLFASGSEVDLALKTSQILENSAEQTVDCRVVSIPNLTALIAHPDVTDKLLPINLPLFGIEAGSTQNFRQLIGRQGFVFGVDHFGLSAPHAVLADHFGFTPEKFAVYILKKLNNK